MDVLPPALDSATLAWLAGLLNFGMVLLLWYALVERAPDTRRIDRVLAERRGVAAGTSRVARLRPDLVRLAGTTVRRLDLLRAKGVARWRELLARAGFRSRESLVVFLFLKVAAPVVAVPLALIFAAGAPFSGQVRLWVGAVVALGGFFLPDLVLARMAARRLARLQRTLPDALDLLVICAEAGLAADAALGRVARELARAAPEAADEFAVTAVELTVLPERRLALENLARRVPLPGIRALTATLVQTERYGTPLAQALRVLAEELRERRLVRAEEKAARLPAVLTVPLIVFILPALFIVLAGPAVLDIQDYLLR